MDELEEQDLRLASYEIFIFAITLLSLFNLFVIVFSTSDDIGRVAIVVNLIISFIFLLDFLFRRHKAEVKRDYLVKQNGWLDLVGSIPIPGFNIARVWHVIRTAKILRDAGARSVMRQVRARRADTALLSIGLAVIYLMEFGSMFILKAEASALEPNIITADDALWWVFVTISTVGYGDKYPVTNTGRLVATFVIFAGVGVFGTISGYLADSFRGQRKTGSETRPHTATDSILAEIKALNQAQTETKQQQEEANAELNARLAALEKFLQENR